MCLIVFNWNNHLKYKLILVANRDEFFDRPSLPIHLWEEGFYAGKDLRAGGTWMGMHSNGKFAALTNYRDLKNPKIDPKSRGTLVRGFLEGDSEPMEYLKHIEKEKNLYDGFNLLVGDSEQLLYYSNYGEGILQLKPGLYGISNALLDSPWVKVNLAKSTLANHINKNVVNADDLVDILSSKSIVPDHLLPDTGMNLYQESRLSAQFIRLEDNYGTVNTTVLLWGRSGKVELLERTYFQLENTNSDKKLSFKTIS